MRSGHAAPSSDSVDRGSRPHWTRLAHNTLALHPIARATLSRHTHLSTRPLASALAVTAISLLLGLEAASAQNADGTALSTLGGTALGMYSGAMFGLVGSLLPCDRTLLGPKCTAASIGAGGVLGAVTGGIIGAEDEDEVWLRLRHAGYGALIGGVVGAAVAEAVRQYAWDDALLVAAVGAAMGAAPKGTSIGAGVGAVIGGLAWAVGPRTGLQDLVLFTVVGASLGGMADWVDGALDATRETSPRITSSFSVPI